ncbi:hypothetical protein [Duganella sp. Root1480D1]|uniref:hypothetical protein n=1 Tax=Duganella sp. Root1480D1 TaxID=1736471 RepID=UPI00070CF92D|nr:hypothetical protein [Duganella sp. Root1480D1]KQZ45198.1 hypothetical protein ASD58_02855 [Duganella sp. Root1480D1]
MTAQVADRLINACLELDLPGYQLFGVFTGVPNSEHEKLGPYCFKAKATPDPRIVSTAVARGYVSLYRLNSSGRLTLNGFAYLPHKGRAPDLVHEEVIGDFWLLFRMSFFGEGVFVPFRNGVLVKDRSQWRHQMSSEGILGGIAARHERARTATIRVHCAEGAPFDFGNFRIYIDGNIHNTPLRLRHLASPTAEVIALEPGAHRIVVREADTRKPNRVESNTAHFEIYPGETLTFTLQQDAEVILLKPLQPFVAEL